MLGVEAFNLLNAGAGVLSEAGTPRPTTARQFRQPGSFPLPSTYRVSSSRCRKGLEKQIYAVSVMAIDLDSQKEAEYLGELASALGLGPSEVNAMHAQFGIPTLYS